MGWLGGTEGGPGEGASLKGASRSFMASAESGVATPVYKRRRAWCCGCGCSAGLLAEFAGSFKVIAIGEPGDRPWFNVFLVLVPLAIISKLANWPQAAQFVLALLAMVPLAERLGFTTESLADHTNDTIGGLMNATMGNLPELIVALFALRDGLLRVVQTSLLGSILSNLLLVMGTAYLVGGVKYSQQSFNTLQTHTGAGLLVLAVMCMLLPAVLDATNTEAINGVSSTTLSRVVSIIMILTYVALMVFQLKTHAYLFDAIENGEPTTPNPAGERHGVVHAHGAAASSASAGGGGHQSMASAAAAAIESGIKSATYSSLPDRSGSVASEDATTSAIAAASAAATPAAAVAATGVAAGVGDGDAKEGDDDDDDDEPPLSIVSSIFWMAVVAGLIAVLSEILVGSIEAFASASGIPDAFASTILLPIAGNAAEHASAIMFAAKNRLDISLGVAVGSSIQIALFVTPFCVLVGWTMGQPLDLNFQVFETVVVFVTVIMTGFVNMEGRTNWLQGLLLVAAYFAIGASFLLHQQPADQP